MNSNIKEELAQKYSDRKQSVFICSAIGIFVAFVVVRYLLAITLGI